MGKRSKRQARSRAARRTAKCVRTLERRMNRMTGEILNAVVVLLGEPHDPADGPHKKKR